MTSTYLTLEKEGRIITWGADRITDKAPKKPNQYRLFIYRELNGGSCRKQNLNYMFLHDERDGPAVLAKKIIEGIINIGCGKA